RVNEADHDVTAFADREPRPPRLGIRRPKRRPARPVPGDDDNGSIALAGEEEVPARVDCKRRARGRALGDGRLADLAPVRPVPLEDPYLGTYAADLLRECNDLRFLPDRQRGIPRVLQTGPAA